MLKRLTSYRRPLMWILSAVMWAALVVAGCGPVFDYVQDTTQPPSPDAVDCAFRFQGETGCIRIDPETSDMQPIGCYPEIPWCGDLVK